MNTSLAEARRRHGRLAAVLLGAVCLGLYLYLYWPLFTAGVFTAPLDITDHFIPSRCFQALALERGELGIWNPFLSRGYPHLAEGQGGLLHPAHLLAYGLLPLAWAVALELALYVPFGFAGMYLFLRRSLGLGSLAALAGAGWFGFSSFMQLHDHHVNMVWVYAHLPWALLGLERTLRGARVAAWAPALCLTFVSMILLGHPQLTWMNALATGFLAVCLTWAAPADQRPARGRLLLAGGALLAALVLGLPQILPTADYVGRSARDIVGFADVSGYALLPANLLVNLSPLLFAAGYVPGTLPGSAAPAWSFESPAYLGVGTLYLLAGAWVMRRAAGGSTGSRRGVVLALAGAAAVVLLMLGPAGGLSWLQYHLPVVGRFRCPSRYLALLAALLAVGGALLLDRLRDLPPVAAPATRRAWRWLALAWAPAGALLAVAWAWPAAFAAAAARSPLGSGPALLAGPVLAALVLTGVWWYAARRPTPLLLAVMVAVALVELVAYGRRLHVPLWQQGQVARLAALDGIRSAMADQGHAYRHYANNNRPVWQGHYLANGYLGLAPVEPLVYSGPASRPEFFYLASVRVAHFADRPGADYTREFPGPLPRARLVPNLRHARDPLDADLPAGHSVPAIVEYLQNTALCLPAAAPELRGPPLAPGETVQLTHDGYATLTLAVNVRQPRLLVLSDRWWPDWQAAVDGQPRAIIPLYGEVLRGLVVQPGERQVTMVYRPRALRYGLGLAAVGLILLLAVCVSARRGYGMRPTPTNGRQP